jgi:hypothetical protein
VHREHEHSSRPFPQSRASPGRGARPLLDVRSLGEVMEDLDVYYLEGQGDETDVRLRGWPRLL